MVRLISGILQKLGGVFLFVCLFVFGNLPDQTQQARTLQKDTSYQVIKI